MARIEGVSDRRAGLLTRVIFWLVRRKIGRMILPIRVAAHQPKLLRGFAFMQLGQEGMRSIDPALKSMCQVKAAMRIGCPF
ncbi:MAG: hypothetical protein HYR85_01655 [Planctomycetes bacterium]|nr:hypothetical protein [Planctomycetota bacterium]MBI3845972.1 hypothetical protein [Planctomycetota bacterium]